MNRVEQSCHRRKARVDQVQGAVKSGRADRVLALITAKHRRPPNRLDHEPIGLNGNLYRLEIADEHIVADSFNQHVHKSGGIDFLSKNRTDTRECRLDDEERLSGGDLRLDGARARGEFLLGIRCDGARRDDRQDEIFFVGDVGTRVQGRGETKIGLLQLR